MIKSEFIERGGTFFCLLRPERTFFSLSFIWHLTTTPLVHKPRIHCFNSNDAYHAFFVFGPFVTSVL